MGELHKKPLCHIRDTLKQAGKFLQQFQVWCNLLVITHIEL